MKKDLSIAALNLANQLTDVNGNVPVHHLFGLPTHWDTVNDKRGSKQVPNYENRIHDLLIPKQFISQREELVHGRKHLVYNPFYDKPERPDLQAKPASYNVIRTDGGQLEVTIEIPKPVEASLEYTLSNDQLVILRTGETKVVVAVMDAANFIHNPTEPLAIKSTNSSIIYDWGLTTMTSKVIDIGRLATGHQNVYNWIK